MTRCACPACRAVFDAPGQPDGKLIACPQCDRRLRAPVPPTSEAITPSPIRSDAVVPAEAPAPLAEEFPALRLAPSFRRSQVKDAALAVCLLAAVGVAGVGCALMLWAGTEAYETHGASENPQEMRLADLVARETRGNPNVLVTAFACGEPVDVTDTRGSPTISSTSYEMWVPLLSEPRGPREGPEKVEAVVYCPVVSRQGEVLRECDRGRVQGLVRSTLGVRPLVAATLQRRYRGTDIARCVVIEAGRTPAGAGAVLRADLGGAALLLAGAITFVLALLCLGWPRWLARLRDHLTLFRRPPASTSL